VTDTDKNSFDRRLPAGAKRGSGEVPRTTLPAPDWMLKEQHFEPVVIDLPVASTVQSLTELLHKAADTTPGDWEITQLGHRIQWNGGSTSEHGSGEFLLDSMGETSTRVKLRSRGRPLVSPDDLAHLVSA
jgi:hypothetical protein